LLSLAIVEFALSFDGYEHYDPASVSKINELAYDAFLNDGSLPRTLNRLRACLFAQQRSWRDSEGPDASSLRFIRALVQRIRRIVERRERSKAVDLEGDDGETFAECAS
jgi:hypothetical protein